MNIAFANELSVLCDKFGIDAWDVIGFANRHPRVSILNPGPGVGGHCIAVDPWFIVASAPEDARLIRQAGDKNAVNRIAPQRDRGEFCPVVDGKADTQHARIVQRQA